MAFCRVGDQVFQIKALTAQLDVKVRAPRGEPDRFKHLVIGQRHLGHVVGVLIRVPARLVVVAVHVDGAEDAKRGSHGQFVFATVSGEDRVPLLDVHLDFPFEAELLEETVDRGDIIVVLVLCGFLRLGLDQDRTLEADLVLVVDHHLQEAPGLRAFAFQVGVEQGLVPLTPAPEYVVFAAQLVSRIDAVLHLCRMQVVDVMASDHNHCSLKQWLRSH